MNRGVEMNNWIQDMDWSLTFLLIVIAGLTIWSLVVGSYIVPGIVLIIGIRMALEWTRDTYN
jgi:hypothetical protein